MNTRNTIKVFLTIILLFNGILSHSQEYKTDDPLAAYSGFYPYEKGYATVGINKKYGFIDKKGRNVVPCKYSFVYTFHKGLAVVELGEKHGLVDTTGREVVPLKYDFIGSFEESDRAIVKLDHKWGFIDKNGKEIIPVIYEQAAHFYGAITTVKENDKWYIIDTLNNRKPVREDFVDLGSFHEGLAAVKIRGKSGWGFINKQGKIVIPPKYDSPAFFLNGLASVAYNGKSGFINKKGEVVVPLLYEGFAHFSDGMAAVTLNDKYGFVNTKGTLVIPAKYSNVYSFYNGMAIIRISGKYGCINKKGETVIPFIYDEMYSGEGNFAVVKDGKGYFIDAKQNILFPEEYQSVDGFKDGTALVKQNGIWFYIDKKGKRLF